MMERDGGGDADVVDFPAGPAIFPDGVWTIGWGSNLARASDFPDTVWKISQPRKKPRWVAQVAALVITHIVTSDEARSH